MPATFPRIVIAFSLIASLIANGCRSNKHPELRPVDGLVTYRDEPVVDATVAFFNDDSKRPATGQTNESGEFYLTSFSDNDGALPGEHIVVVTKTITDAIDSNLSMDEAMNAPKSKASSRNWLPAIYASVKTSPLRATVGEQGEKGLTLELSDAPRSAERRGR